MQRRATVSDVLSTQASRLNCTISLALLNLFYWTDNCVNRSDCRDRTYRICQRMGSNFVRECTRIPIWGRRRGSGVSFWRDAKKNTRARAKGKDVGEDGLEAVTAITAVTIARMTVAQALSTPKLVSEQQGMSPLLTFGVRPLKNAPTPSCLTISLMIVIPPTLELKFAF